MNNLNIFRMAKWIFIIAIISATTLSFSEAKADFVFPAGSSAKSEPGALTWMHDESIDNIAQTYPVSEYNNEILLAAAKDTTQTAKKKTPPKSASSKTENNISVSVKAAYLMPMGDLSKLFDYGYGGTLGISFNNMFARNLAPGIETGYLNLVGKDDTVGSEYIIPFFAVLKYKFNISKSLEISPMLAAGGGYFSITYKPAGKAEKTKSEFESMAKAGISASYNATSTFAIEAKSEYCMIFEKDGRLPFILFQFGCSIGF